MTPYSVHLNDIASFDFPGFHPGAYEQQLIDEFDQLYAERATRRRIMVIGLHERISGHASRVRTLDRISPGCAATKACGGPARTPRPVSVLPGRSA